MELISTSSNAATVAFTSVPPVRASRREFTSTTREHFRVTPSLDARSNWCFRSGLIALRMPLKPNDSSRDGAGPRSRPSFAVISPCCNDLPAAGCPIDPHGEERGTAVRLEPRGHGQPRGTDASRARRWRQEVDVVLGGHGDDVVGLLFLHVVKAPEQIVEPSARRH